MPNAKKIMNRFLSRFKSSDLFKDSFWALSGNVIGKGLSLLATLYVTKLLGSDASGELGMIKATLTNLAFYTLSLGYASTKHIAEKGREKLRENREVHNVVSSVTILISLVVAFFVYVFSQDLAYYLDAPNSAGYFKITSWVVVFNSINNVQLGELGGFRAYKYIAYNTLWAGIVIFVLGITFTFIWGMSGFLIALGISSMTSCALNAISLKKFYGEYRLFGRFRIEKFKKLMSFSFPIALQNGISFLSMWIVTLLLIKMSDYHQVGLAYVGSIWFNMMIFIPGAINNVILSHLSSASKDGHIILKRFVLVNFVVSLIPTIVAWLLSGVIENWYGPSYYGLKNVLIVSTSASIIVGVSNVYYNEMIALRKNWLALGVLLFSYVINILLAYIFILNFGNAAVSSKMAFLISQTVYLLALVLMYHNVYKQLVKRKS